MFRYGGCTCDCCIVVVMDSCLFSGEPSATDCLDQESTGHCHLMSVTDTASVTSTDSNLPLYQMIANRSADSSSSFCMEQSSYSDRSDTEVLLRGMTTCQLNQLVHNGPGVGY